MKRLESERSVSNKLAREETEEATGKKKRCCTTDAVRFVFLPKSFYCFVYFCV